MKLEEGMYVRTKYGIIDKVIINYSGHCNNPNCNCKHVSCKKNYYDDEDIVKASHNIIDLIEEGDYVNGRPVFINEYGYLEQTCINADGDVYYETLRVENIKDIATKEQFDSMKYEVDSNE